MKGVRTAGVFLFAMAGLAVVRVAPQAILEDTISGSISATKVIMQNTRLTADVTAQSMRRRASSLVHRASRSS